MVTQREIDKIRNQAIKDIDFFVDENKENILKKLTPIFLAGVATTKKYLDSTREISMTERQRNVFTDIIAESIKGVSEDYKRELNTSLNIGLSQSETQKQLKQRVDEIIKGNNPTKMKYEKRLDLIIRTESARIFNGGAMRTAKQLGAKFKYLIGVNDNRQGQDSKVALRKYGSPEKAIPIDEEFIVQEGGKTYTYSFPPNRPNDRETCIFIYEKPQSN